MRDELLPSTPGTLLSPGFAHSRQLYTALLPDDAFWFELDREQGNLFLTGPGRW
jgi:hypothetical protein